MATGYSETDKTITQTRTEWLMGRRKEVKVVYP